MQKWRKDKATIFFILACCIAFAVIVLRAFFIPLSHDEAATFFFYVQSGNYLPYKAVLYTNNHILNSALANVFYEIAGSHRFVLRLPNILSFIILCFAVFRIFRFLNSGTAKIALTFLLLLNIHFLDFFELCRGYGLSMALLTLGFSFLLDYFREKKFTAYLWLSVFFQLALAANLTLIVLLAIVFGVISIFQIKEKLFLSVKNIFLLLFNFLLILFWLRFTLFYKEHGLLDSGAPENYWQTTFVSLMLLVFGTDYLWIQISCAGIFLVCVFFAGSYILKNKFRFKDIFSPRIFFIILFLCLVVSFYGLNKIADVNFPEDRTALFLYVIFSISLAFVIEISGLALKKFITLCIGIFVVFNFFLFFNLQTFCHYFYHVTPKSFYSILEKEFLKTNQIFTVGGNPAREMVYTFANYRGSSMLNPMDDSRLMYMNCDYYVALKYEEPYYRHFYEELAHDKYWNRVLLKRKYPIERSIEFRAEQKKYSGNDEFIEFVRLPDSLIHTRNCIDAEVELTFDSIPAPFQSWLVLQINGEGDSTIVYKKIPFYWLADDLNGKTKRLRLTSPPLPQKFKSLIVYIWNTDKKNVVLTLNELTIFKLKAKGINFVIPKAYYEMSPQLTDKVLL